MIGPFKPIGWQLHKPMQCNVLLHIHAEYMNVSTIWVQCYIIA